MSELEEKEREETFRLKIFKKSKYKKLDKDKNAMKKQLPVELEPNIIQSEPSDLVFVENGKDMKSIDPYDKEKAVMEDVNYIKALILSQTEKIISFEEEKIKGDHKFIEPAKTEEELLDKQIQETFKSMETPVEEATLVKRDVCTCCFSKLEFDKETEKLICPICKLVAETEKTQQQMKANVVPCQTCLPELKENKQRLEHLMSHMNEVLKMAQDSKRSTDTPKEELFSFITVKERVEHVPYAVSKCSSGTSLKGSVAPKDENIDHGFVSPKPSQQADLLSCSCESQQQDFLPDKKDDQSVTCTCPPTPLVAPYYAATCFDTPVSSNVTPSFFPLSQSALAVQITKACKPYLKRSCVRSKNDIYTSFQNYDAERIAKASKPYLQPKGPNAPYGDRKICKDISKTNRNSNNSSAVNFSWYDEKKLKVFENSSSIKSSDTLVYSAKIVHQYSREGQPGPCRVHETSETADRPRTLSLVDSSSYVYTIPQQKKCHCPKVSSPYTREGKPGPIDKFDINDTIKSIDTFRTGLSYPAISEGSVSQNLQNSPPCTPKGYPKACGVYEIISMDKIPERYGQTHSGPCNVRDKSNNNEKLDACRPCHIISPLRRHSYSGPSGIHKKSNISKVPQICHTCRTDDQIPSADCSRSNDGKGLTIYHKEPGTPNSLDSSTYVCTISRKHKTVSSCSRQHVPCETCQLNKADNTSDNVTSVSKQVTQSTLSSLCLCEENSEDILEVINNLSAPYYDSVVSEFNRSSDNVPLVPEPKTALAMTNFKGCLCQQMHNKVGTAILKASMPYFINSSPNFNNTQCNMTLRLKETQQSTSKAINLPNRLTETHYTSNSAHSNSHPKDICAPYFANIKSHIVNESKKCSHCNILCSQFITSTLCPTCGTLLRPVDRYPTNSSEPNTSKSNFCCATVILVPKTSSKSARAARTDSSCEVSSKKHRMIPRSDSHKSLHHTYDKRDKESKHATKGTPSHGNHHHKSGKVCSTSASIASKHDNQKPEIGYFETGYKEITKVSRYKNPDGTITSEKQVITITTKKKSPRKPNEENDHDVGTNVNCCQEYDVPNSAADEEKQEGCCARETQSETKQAVNSDMTPSPKIKSCLSAPECRKTKSQDTPCPHSASKKHGHRSKKSGSCTKFIDSPTDSLTKQKEYKHQIVGTDSGPTCDCAGAASDKNINKSTQPCYDKVENSCNNSICDCADVASEKSIQTCFEKVKDSQSCLPLDRISVRVIPKPKILNTCTIPTLKIGDNQHVCTRGTDNSSAKRPSACCPIQSSSLSFLDLSNGSSDQRATDKCNCLQKNKNDEQDDYGISASTRQKGCPNKFKKFEASNDDMHHACKCKNNTTSTTDIAPCGYTRTVQNVTTVSSETNKGKCKKAQPSDDTYTIKIITKPKKTRCCDKNETTEVIITGDMAEKLSKKIFSEDSPSCCPVKPISKNICQSCDNSQDWHMPESQESLSNAQPECRHRSSRSEGSSEKCFCSTNYSESASQSTKTDFAGSNSSMSNRQCCVSCKTSNDSEENEKCDMTQTMAETVDGFCSCPVENPFYCSKSNESYRVIMPWPLLIQQPSSPKDATTSTRLSDRYDVRPLKKLESACLKKNPQCCSHVSDSHLSSTSKKENKFHPRYHSYNSFF